MFWDGSRWVDERPVSQPRVQRGRRLTDLIATISILLIIPVLLLPYLANAGEAQLQVTGTAVPGGMLDVAGTGLTKRLTLQLAWDGSSTGMPSVRVRNDGTFRTTITVPTKASVSMHVLSVVARKAPGARTASLTTDPTGVLASVSVTVVASAGGGAQDPGPTATAVPQPDPTNAPVATNPPDPTAAPPDPTAAPPDPTPTPKPVPTPAGSSVTVSSISGLLAALNDNSITDIVVANGRYRISAAGSQAANSLWIGSRFADRTNPVTVRAETRGGVIFDGGGTSYFGCISFEEGAHDQTWDGFTCTGGQATSTGVIVFGGYAGKAAPHHITIRHLTITAGCTGRSTSISSGSFDHAVYFSYAAGGPHDLLFTDITVDGRGGLTSAFHFDHSAAGSPNAWNVTVRRLTVTGTQQAIILWDPTPHDVVFDTATISNALAVAVRYEGGSNITLANITSTGSGTHGFYSSLGAHPPEVTFSNDIFN